MNTWPDGKWTELATRLILGCSDQRFRSFNWKSAEVTVNDKKSIQQIIELLGGQWPNTIGEKVRSSRTCIVQMHAAPGWDKRLLLGQSWRSLARVTETKRSNWRSCKPISLCVVPISAPEDTKRAVIDSQVSTNGKLTIPRVSGSIRLLGADFFQEITVLLEKKTRKLKTYDARWEWWRCLTNHAYRLTWGNPWRWHGWHTGSRGWHRCDLIADFEAAVTDVLQGDEELASALKCVHWGAKTP